MDLRSYFDSQLQQHVEALELVQSLLFESFRATVKDLVLALGQGRKLLFFGNGGSAADAQHLATEFKVRFEKDRTSLAALSLTTDSSTLTAIGNDYGFEELFARQIEALGRPGDVAVGISTSGNSENVVRALRAAHQIGARTVALGGRDGGRMKGFADHLLIVPADSTARIQEMHILIGHLLIGAVEKEMGLV